MDLSGLDLVLVFLVVALVVVVIIESQRLTTLRDRVTRIERAVRPNVPLGASGLPPEVEQEARWLVTSGKKIMAIKVVRDHTGLGLKEAKQLVDRF